MAAGDTAMPMESGGCTLNVVSAGAFFQSRTSLKFTAFFALILFSVRLSFFFSRFLSPNNLNLILASFIPSAL